MTAATDPFSAWLAQAHIPEHRLTPDQRGVLRAAFHFRQAQGHDAYSTRLLTHFWRELRPSSGKAEALGHYQTTVGDYQKLFAVADGYSAVTAAEVQRVVKQYLRPERRTVVIATPSKEDA